MEQGTTTNPELADRIRTVLSEVIDRRTAGERLSDDDVVKSHSDLMPHLREELAHLREIELACSNEGSAEQAFDLLTHLRPRLTIPGYELLSEINSGGQAIVYLARQNESGKQVALKVLRDGRLADDRQRERLRREAKILASLEHPNIVAVLDSGTTPDGHAFLVMNYIAGEPLEPEALANRMSLQERLQMFLTICHAVSAAHERGIVHRDIKPSNIRLNEAGVPHVLDFGLASPAPGSSITRLTMTTTGQFLGSFLWASPEQLSGAADVTAASDVYSLGVLLHQLATGGSFPPHVFTTMMRTLGQQPKLATSKLAKLQRELTAVSDEELSSIIDRCLAPTPQERYANAAEVANDVMAYLTQPRRSRSRRGLALVIGTTVLAILLASVAAFHWFGPHPNQSQRLINGRPIKQIPQLFAMVWIPPGEATLGTPDGTPLRMPDEYVHTVKFGRGFYLACTEITRGSWELIMGPQDSADPPKEGQGQDPVANVSWYDAVEFCRRLSEREHRTFRLPTEDEWEYAARAGDTGAYPWFIHVTSVTEGDWRLLPRYANFADVSSGRPGVDPRYDDGYAGVAPAYTYISNSWGLSDMIGNVWEWTGQPYRHDLSHPPRIPATQPLYLSTRGGSFFDNPHTFRYGNRNPLPADHKGGNVGFRVVCEDDGPTP